MATWASKPGSLFWRDSAGRISRWDPGSGLNGPIANVSWTGPKASANGLWIAYTAYDSGGLPHVGLFSVQSNSPGPQPAGVRSQAQFINSDLAWYEEETPCDCGLAGASQPSGRTFLYSVSSGTETGSRITGLFDVWPKVTAPPGFG